MWADKGPRWDKFYDKIELFSAFFAAFGFMKIGSLTHSLATS